MLACHGRIEPNRLSGKPRNRQPRLSLFLNREIGAGLLSWATGEGETRSEELGDDRRGEYIVGEL